MPQLVKEDERPQLQRERQYGEQQAGRLDQTTQSFTRSPAYALASASIAKTASRLSGAAGGGRASVSPTIAAISRKLSRPERKAATATSLAALRIAGRAPAASSAERARARAGQ